jgi:hypothetical protein
VEKPGRIGEVRAVRKGSGELPGSRHLRRYLSTQL